MELRHCNICDIFEIKFILSLLKSILSSSGTDRSVDLDSPLHLPILKRHITGKY